MASLADIPLSVLHNDRAASLMDIKTVQKLQTDTIYGMSADEFIRQNKHIIEIIDAELARRGETP